MNIISAENVTHFGGDKKLFENIAFGVHEGDKIAIVGLNGCGKSSFLDLIADKNYPQSGLVTKNRSCTIHYAEQDPSFNSCDTIAEHLFKSDFPHITLIKKYELCCENLKSSYSETLQKELDSLTEEMDALNAWQYEGEIRAVLSAFGLKDLTQKMGELSGGMVKKISLAQAVIANPDLLILDEPTNHLDIDSILWLQEYLIKKVKTLLMVTHDRYFLESVCNSIWEIAHTSLFQYAGNFTAYLEKKAEFEEAELRREQKIKSLLKKEIEWMHRTPCARGTKQKARIDRVYDMMEHKGLSNNETVTMTISGRRLGKKVLEVKKLTKNYDGKSLIKSFSYIFKKGQRIGIVGPNGSGKTTFINLLTGNLQADQGTRDSGINTHFGIFNQTQEDLDPNQTLIAHIKEIAEVISLDDGSTITAGQLLERFLFPKKAHYTTIEKLSGGEQRRLQLCATLMQNPNFLIFDEPTNNLDIYTLETLEDFLLDYSGTLLVISHDRFFLDKVIDTLFVLGEDDGIFEFPSGYSDYLEWRGTQTKQKQKTKKTTPEKSQSQPKKQKRTWKEETELKKIIKEIEDLESETEKIEQSFAENTALGEELKKQTIRYKEIEELLSVKMNRWEELENIG